MSISLDKLLSRHYTAYMVNGKSKRKSFKSQEMEESMSQREFMSNLKRLPDKRNRRVLLLSANFGLCRAVAREAGVSPQYVSAVLSGKRRTRRIQDLVCKHAAVPYTLIWDRAA